MNLSVGKYIESIISKSEYNRSMVAREINISRQQLSSIILGKRELSLPIALKLESLFSIPEGKLLKLQTVQNIKSYKASIKEQLLKKLLDSNAFWSYSDVNIDNVLDEDIIEKTFIVLDMPDIAKLFELYPRSFVKNVWKERMAIQGDYLINLNIMIALYYFNIKKPEAYLEKIERQHINKIIKNA